MRILIHGSLFLGLTVLTQIGGLAWLLACLFRRRTLAFLLFYAGASFSAVLIAPQFGRVALSCGANSTLQVQSWFYCATNRRFVTPQLRETLETVSSQVAETYPGTITAVLDANFPFLDGFPLPPHLSHNDGKKADLALYYKDVDGTYLPGQTRSPVGYFAFEDGRTHCPKVWPSLRWDFDVLQPYWRDLALEGNRTRYLMTQLQAQPSVRRIFLEPHLVTQLDLGQDRIGFQGCRAARHDDHIHIEIK